LLLGKYLFCIRRNWFKFCVFRRQKLLKSYCIQQSVVHSLAQHLISDIDMKSKSLKYSHIEQKDIVLVQNFAWIRKRMALLSLKVYYFNELFLYIYSDSTFLSCWKRPNDQWNFNYTFSTLCDIFCWVNNVVQNRVQLKSLVRLNYQSHLSSSHVFELSFFCHKILRLFPDVVFYSNVH